MNEANQTRSQRWFLEGWNERNLATVDELLDDDCAGHMESGDVNGVDAFKAARADILAMFPDLTFTVEDMVSDADDVVIRWRATGTHAGDGHGLKATRKPVTFSGITWHRYRDGKLVEGWDAWNQGGLMMQLQQASATS